MGSRESRGATPGHPDPPVPIGVVVAGHGVRGTLRVRAIGDGRHLRKGVEPVLAGARRRISAVRHTPRGFLVDVAGVESRAEVNALKGQELLLDRDQLDVPEEGEFYVADLVGLVASNDAGEIVGTVEDTFETAAHEVLVVREVDGDQNLYVPFTLEHVPDLDLAAGRVVIRPPEE